MKNLAIKAGMNTAMDFIAHNMSVISFCIVGRLSRSRPPWRWAFLALLLAAVPARAADINAGRALYTNYCAGCHGQNGEGVLPGAPNFRMDTGRLMRPDTMLVESIRNGRNAMPAFRGVLTDRQLFDVVAFLRTLR